MASVRKTDVLTVGQAHELREYEDGEPRRPPNRPSNNLIRRNLLTLAPSAGKGCYRITEYGQTLLALHVPTHPSGESVEEKGRRLLCEGRLTVETVLATKVVASCKGDSGEVYSVGWDRRGWRCTCPARVRCSHLVALQLVTRA